MACLWGHKHAILSPLPHKHAILSPLERSPAGMKEERKSPAQRQDYWTGDRDP